MILRIRELREERNMTQTELAEKIQNVQRNISNWENGKSEPDCQSILALANVFKVPIDRLFGRVFSGGEALSKLDRELHSQIDKLSYSQKKCILQLINEFSAMQGKPAEKK